MYFYNPPKPKKYLYNKDSQEPFKLSRSAIDSFLRCQRCFYLDKRLGIGQPPGYPFTLNSAVDYLLKKEFDLLRKTNSCHPLMEKCDIDAIPFAHKDLNIWRENFKGVRYLHPETNFLITGAIDDLWINNKTKELHIVDYKSTSKNGEVNLDADWQDGYKRQMEIYQWLFRNNGFKVSDLGYFVYCNGITETEKFDAKLEFDIKIISYKGKSDWVDSALKKAKQILDSDSIPEPDKNCNYCKYRSVAQALESADSTPTQSESSHNSATQFSDGKLF